MHPSSTAACRIFFFCYFVSFSLHLCASFVVSMERYSARVVIVAAVVRGYTYFVFFFVFFFFFSLHLYAVHFIKFYSTSHPNPVHVVSFAYMFFD